MFTGRRADNETALYYYRARYYAFDIGRFLQTDPIGYADSMNLYIYVGNNPLVWVDPWGFCGETPWYRVGASAQFEVAGSYGPAGSRAAPTVGGGVDIVWIPGKGARKYIYGQVGGSYSPKPYVGGTAVVGVGPVFRIENHEQYKGSYNNIQVMSPTTQYGAFGGDVSWIEGGPTAVHFNWGLSTGGGSYMRQEYIFAEDVPSFVGAVIDTARQNVPHNREIKYWLDAADSGW